MGRDKVKENKRFSYFDLALLAFGGLGLEVVLIFIESALYGTSNTSEWEVGKVLLHWGITWIIWGIVSYLVYKNAKKNGFDLFAIKEKPSIRNLILTILALCLAIFIGFIDWGYEFKPIAEFIGKTSSYGMAGGTVAFLFQYVYYFIESVLFILIIALGQQAGEDKFKVKYMKYIPWGGIMCGLTWGLVHILTKGLATGLGCLVMSILYGIVYLLLKKNIRYAYIIISLMFAL